MYLSGTIISAFHSYIRPTVTNGIRSWILPLALAVAVALALEPWVLFLSFLFSSTTSACLLPRHCTGCCRDKIYFHQRGTTTNRRQPHGHSEKSISSAVWQKNKQPWPTLKCNSRWCVVVDRTNGSGVGPKPATKFRAHNLNQLYVHMHGLSRALGHRQRNWPAILDE